MNTRLSLTEGPLPPSLLPFALPILLGNVLQSVNGSVNAIWVGKYLGETAFAAGNLNVVMFLLFGVMFGFSMASTVMVAQCIGGALIALIYLLNRDALGLFLPTHRTAIEIAVHLNNIVLWCFALFGMSMVLFGVVRATGAVAAAYYRFGGWRTSRTGVADAKPAPVACA